MSNENTGFSDMRLEPSRTDLEAIDRAMQHRGDALNSLDLADEEDEKITSDGFAAIARLLKSRAADTITFQPTEARIIELEAQLVECSNLAQRWAHAAGFADGQFYNAREVLRLALMEHSIANYQGQMHVGHWSHKARNVLLSSEKEGGEAKE